MGVKKGTETKIGVVQKYQFLELNINKALLFVFQFSLAGICMLFVVQQQDGEFKKATETSDKKIIIILVIIILTIWMGLSIPDALLMDSRKSAKIIPNLLLYDYPLNV